MAIQGQRTSQEDQKWFDAAREVTPQRSLETAERLANFVFANIAVVGTLITGFGLVVDPVSLADTPHVKSIPLPVVLASLSLVSAVVAMTPALTRINPAQVDQVRRWYTRQILRRGIATICAMLLFAAALISITVAVATAHATDPRISAAWSGVGKNATLSLKVAVAGMPTSARCVSHAYGVKPSGAQTSLLSATTKADAAGDLALKITVDEVGAYERIELSSVVRNGSKELGRTTVRMERPASRGTATQP
jgi:hypothetical protein